MMSIVLSSTQQNLPINRQQCYPDTMVSVKKYGDPDYFINMIWNPQKPEI